MNQIHYAILDHNDRYYKLEETTQYIEINLIHTTYYYVNGVEKKAKKKYPVRNCEPKDFVDPDPGATEMSRYYQAEVVKKKQNFICLSDEALELKIEGNLQSRKAYNERNTFISFQIDWCKKNCASDDDIKAWLFNKQLEPLAFNRKPALATFGRISRPSFS